MAVDASFPNGVSAVAFGLVLLMVLLMVLIVNKYEAKSC